MKAIQSYTAAKQSGILLNANENSNALAEDIREEILDAVASIDFNRYPDTDETELLEAYGKRIGVTAEQLLAGNGSDQMLGYLIGTFLGKGKVLCTLSPDFSMYDYYASGYEAEVVKFKTAEDGSFKADEFIAFAKENNADMILFSNPNNPTGFCMNTGEIAKICAGLSDIPCVIDEAYMDFADEESSLGLIGKYSNLYVTRTLSKAYGMAGIRLGFLISSVENMKPLKRNFVPYALNSVSMKIACVVLKHADVFEKQIAEIKTCRNAMYDKLVSHQRLHIYPSQANFLYGYSADKERMLQMMEENNIVIRDYRGTDFFRITIGTAEENEAVLAVLKQFGEEL